MTEPIHTPKNPQAIHSIRFVASKIGLQTQARDEAMMDDAELDAKKWMWDHQDTVEVVSISSALGSATAMVTVWYRS